MSPIILARLALAACLAHPLAAQDTMRARRLRPPRDDTTKIQTGNRRALEQRFRERFAAVVQDRVGLTNDQMAKLAETNQRFESRRRELLRREREARVGLRAELMGAATADEDQVGQRLDATLRLQRDAADLLIEEHADMARYMTPSQRARFFGIQEQMRRRVDSMRPVDAFVGPDSAPRPFRRQAPPGRPGRRPGIPR